MAGELQASFMTGRTCYFLLRDRNANIASLATSGLVAYNTNNYSGYTISAAEQGTASAYYTGNIPGWIPAGSYGAILKQQLGANPAESDPTVDVGNVDWNGSNVAQLSDVPVSGSQYILLTRSWMIKNYMFDLRSNADHITPLTSGVVSGQISKDGAAFTSLQSGAFTEVGLGTYSLQALTSGDLNAGTITLVFTATGADQLTQHFITQRTSGF